MSSVLCSCLVSAEGLFPQRITEDPLLLDEFRQVVDEHLRLREDHVHQERQRLHMAVGAARDRLIASYPRMEVAEARPPVPVSTRWNYRARFMGLCRN